MGERRIARELAVILLPQLPKDRAKLARQDVNHLVGRSVQQLTEYAKQCLADANSFLLASQEHLQEQELEHKANAANISDLVEVPVTTGQLRAHTDRLERAIHLISEALDVPEMVCDGKDNQFLFELVSTYLDHKEEIDDFISQAKSKWRIERMVSIDRDILRLACAEAFYIVDVPIRVCISEAVELSHRFADDRAAKFINGILADLSDAARQYRQTGKFSITGLAEADDGADKQGNADKAAARQGRQ